MRAKLKRVASVYTGSTPPTGVESYYTSEDVAWYTPGDIPDESICSKGASKSISKLYFDEKSCKIFPKESVLMVGIGATVGKVCYCEQPCYANQQINAIIFNRNEVLPKYGAYFLLNISKVIKSITPIVTLQIFNQSKVKQIEIDYPDLEIQRRIVSYLDSKTAEIDNQISLLAKKRDAYMRLKKSIINRAVTQGLNPDVEMKESGIDWIGMLPKHWEIKRIKELCPFISRGSTPDYVDEGDYLVMNQAVFSSGSINYEIVRFSSYMKEDSKIEKGDLLIASTGGGILGKLYFFDDEQIFYADTHVTIVRNKKKSFHVKFLYYLLSIGYNMINSCMAKGSTNQTELQRDKLIAFEIAVPPLDEQKQIIEYLDIKCANIEAAIKNIGRQIDASKRLKRALINEVVTGQRAV